MSAVSLRKYWFVAGLFLLSIIMPQAGLCDAGSAAIHSIAPGVLQVYQRQDTQTVIVAFSPEAFGAAAAAKHAAVAADPLLLRRAVKLEAVERIAPLGPVEIRHQYPQLNMMALTISKEQALALAGLPSVSRMYENRVHRAMLDTSVPFIGANDYHAQGFTGEGTAVAVIDSPVRYWNGHFGDCENPGDPDCSIKVWENFTTNDNRSVANGEGHGSNVAGIVLGVAPDTDILSLNVFHYDSSYGGYLAYVTDEIAALDWVIAHKEDYNIVAVNMSLGSERYSPKPCNDSESYEAVKTLWEKDILVAISSGNDGRVNSVGSPACITLAIATGAQFDTDLRLFPSLACRSLEPNLGEVACFSNLNGMLDIVAPGAFVSAGGLEDYGGTSMAAPHVAGAAALLHSFWQNRGDTPTAPLLHRAMQIMAVPRPSRGYVYKQLNFFTDAYPAWRDLHMFPYYYKEEQEALIPKAPEAYALTETVADPGYAIGGTYLHIEVIHASPEDIEVTVTAPDATAVTVTLPGGLDNYNGVIGKEYFPGVFEAFRGKTIGGDWSVSLSDTGDDEQGYYVSATLYWTGDDCEPVCEGRACGDDGCGGSCGDCGTGWYCSATRECVLDGESCKGDSCDSAVEIPVESAVYEGTTLDCQSLYSAFCGGSLAGEKFYTFSVESPTFFSAEVMGFNTVLYLYKDTCESRARFCVEDTMEDSDDGGSRLDAGMLDPGRYFLAVDGYYERGYYQLTIEACTPDCEAKTCGDDGCGGSCGTCADNAACSDEGSCQCLHESCGDVCCAEGLVCNDENACAAPVKEDKGGGDGCAGGSAMLWLLLCGLLVWRRQQK